MEKRPDKLKHTFNRFLRILGPGLVTGAADDDPSGIATYSQTGAQFGFQQLWTIVFTLPFMIAIQEACARIGMATGKGIVAVVKQRYAKRVALAIAGLVLVANIINIGADIGAMAAAAELILPINFMFAALLFVAVILVLQISASYRTYARILKWCSLFLITYPLTLLIVNAPWRTIFAATFIPHIEFNFSFIFIITAVIGTTISPYLFFWEADQEVEEERRKHLLAHDAPPVVTKRRMRTMRFDNAVGMIASNIVSWCIIVTTGTVLGGHGDTIRTAADAARALEPLVHSFPNAGMIARSIFAAGIIGLGLLAVPVLSTSASYAVAEVYDWKAGLNRKMERARGFYGVIAIATLIGLAINFIGINPIFALIVASVVNGVVAVPLIGFIAVIARDKSIMGDYASGRLSNVFVWLTGALMALTAVALFAAL